MLMIKKIASIISHYNDKELDIAHTSCNITSMLYIYVYISFSFIYLCNIISMLYKSLLIKTIVDVNKEYR